MMNFSLILIRFHEFWAINFMSGNVIQLFFR